MTGRPKRRFCLRGHDTSKLGRYPAGNCIACCRDRDKGRDRRNRTPRRSRRPEPSVPAQPMRDILGTQINAARVWMGYRMVAHSAARRAAERLWSTDRISIWVADHWCIAAGYHLSEVYPELYQEAS